MIVKVTRKICDSNLRALLRVGHRRMRALRYQHIERSDTSLRQKIVRDWKQHMRVIVARLVGNDREHAFTRLDHVERVVNNRY